MTIEYFNTWLKNAGITKKAAAEAMGISYPGLVRVLTGKAPLSPSMIGRFRALIESRKEKAQTGLQVVIPDEYVPMIQGLAELAGCSVPEMVERLLVKALEPWRGK